jgi:hypothetical protein
VHFTGLGVREDKGRTKPGLTNAAERKRYEVSSATQVAPGDTKLFAGHHSISNPLLEMKRITGGGSTTGRCKKFFGKPRPRAIVGIEHVPSARGHSPLPLGRIFPVERIESFISVKCETDDPKTEMAFKTIRKRPKFVHSIVIAFSVLLRHQMNK